MRKRLSAGDTGYLRINLTPMIDIVFLLLIFFVLIAQFSSRQLAQVQLPVPQPSAAKYLYSPDVVTITAICSQQGKLQAYQIEGPMIGPEQPGVLHRTL